VRGTDGCRGYAVPFRSPPARCQIPEDLLECSTVVNGQQTWDVLEEQPAGSDVDRGSPDERPEPSFVIGAESSTGDASTLAGETGSDEIHAIAERFAVKGSQIVPDRTCSQVAFDHSICEDGSGVGLPLNSTHKTNSGASASDGALEAAVSGAEGERGSGTNNHKLILLYREHDSTATLAARSRTTDVLPFAAVRDLADRGA
jgi:hypothetical protein